MNRIFRVSSQAQQDIADALRWTPENFGERKLDEYIELIALARDDILADPEEPPAKRRPDLHPDARVFPIARPGRRARHVFVYRPADQGVIEVARFLYDAADLASHLPETYKPEL